MSEVELRHVEAGRVAQMEWERDQLCVERDEAEAEGDDQRARELQLVINDLVQELALAGRGSTR